MSAAVNSTIPLPSKKKKLSLLQAGCGDGVSLISVKVSPNSRLVSSTVPLISYTSPSDWILPLMSVELS